MSAWRKLDAGAVTEATPMIPFQMILCAGSSPVALTNLTTLAVASRNHSNGPLLGVGGNPALESWRSGLSI